MKLQETLTKANFWDEMHQKHPNATSEFCEWIDRYKEAANWNKLFNSDSDWQDMNGKNAPAPKFHDLPYAFQLGVWLTYVKSFDESSEYITAMIEDHDFILELGSMIDCFFSIREEEMKESENDQ